MDSTDCRSVDGWAPNPARQATSRFYHGLPIRGRIPLSRTPCQPNSTSVDGLPTPSPAPANPAPSPVQTRSIHSQPANSTMDCRSVDGFPLSPDTLPPQFYIRGRPPSPAPANPTPPSNGIKEVPWVARKVLRKFRGLPGEHPIEREEVHGVRQRALRKFLGDIKGH